MKVVILGRSKTEAAKSKTETATALAGLGGAIGSVFGPAGGAIGAGIGGVTGLIIGDNTTVFPIDMIAIPAYQSYMISKEPAFTVYIKAGETLVPTGGNVADMSQNLLGSVDIKEGSVTGLTPVKGTRGATAYNKAYSKAFKSIQNDHKTKSGSWKKNGYKRAVKIAHRLARANMKGGKK